MSSGQLFGAEKFPPGSAKYITVFEGAPDAMAGRDILGDYPCVAIRSSSTARADIEANYEYLHSFERIYLCFDNDGPGQEAAKEAATALVDFNKVYKVELGAGYKDANEYLERGQAELLRKAWWNAKRFLPENIVSSWSEIDEIIDNDKVTQGISFPWPRLDEMTYGMHKGQFILITAPEGIGKTEFLGHIEEQVLKEDPEANIGIIHLEESKARVVKRLAGYVLNQPVHLPDTTVSNDEVKAAFRKLSIRDDRIHLYSHFGSDDPKAILGMLRLLIGPCACKYIFLDHISMVVSGLEQEDERKALDMLSTQFKMLAEQFGIVFVCVSHVNDDGKTRGSRNISKVADLRIDLYRDLTSDDPVSRNTTSVTVSKNRLAGGTGPAGKLVFDSSNYRMTEEGDTFGIPPVEART